MLIKASVPQAGDNILASPHHKKMLRELTAHLEQLKFKKTIQRQEPGQVLLQDTQTPVIKADDSLQGSVEKIQQLAGDVFNVQLGVGAGKSEMWVTVVHVYWSFLFSSWIRGQIDGTGTM